MERCRETAFCLTLWYAVLTVIVAVLAIALHDLERSTALLAAANIALMFALVLMARAGGLTDINIMRGQFWRTLPASERPRGETGRRMARTALERTWLQFAKGAAALAIVLCALAYTSHGTSTSASAQARPASAHDVD
ncbi:MAG: hypothetical protein WCE79_26940 [Xanthobacteraceae bacterium]